MSLRDINVGVSNEVLMKSKRLEGCWQTGLPVAICGHCLYPELYKIAEEIARPVLAQCNERARGVQSEMPYRDKFVLETVIQILTRSV
jgi:hypothetical protein